MSTLEKIQDGSAVIGVVGLGYVGLPLVLGYAGKKFRVIGLDIDPAKVEAISAGQSYIEHIPGEPIANAVMVIGILRPIPTSSLTYFLCIAT